MTQDAITKARVKSTHRLSCFVLRIASNLLAEQIATKLNACTRSMAHLSTGIGLELTCRSGDVDRRYQVRTGS